MAADNQIIRQLSIYINDRQVVNSMSGIDRAIRTVRNQIRNLDASSADYDERMQELTGTLGQLTNQSDAFREQLNATSEEMNAGSDAWGKFMNGLRSGDLAGAAEGLKGLKAGLIASVNAAKAFVMTPLGATIAVLAGIAVATREWAKYNIEAAKANRETTAITKLSGQALNDARVTAQALAKTFDKDFTEILETARANVNEFGITYAEAFAAIEEGLIKGGAANDEFLESMREYPAFFAKAGYSIKEFQNLVNTGIDLGIYQDKLPDAIKEFALSVNEQTKGTKDALYNAFGTNFTDGLLKGVKDGSITVKEALEEISKEAERIGLNSQQAQQLTADLFRGAGEDAGGAVKIFQAVNTSLGNMTRPLSEVETSIKDLARAELELAEAQDRALKSDAWEQWANFATKQINQVKEGFYNMLYLFTNGDWEAFKKGGPIAYFQSALNNLKEGKEVKEIAATNKRILDNDLNLYKQSLAARRKLEGEKFNYDKFQADWIAKLREKGAVWDADVQKRYDDWIKGIEEFGKKEKEITNKNDLAKIEADKKAAAELKKQRKAAAEKENERLKKQAEKDAADLKKYHFTLRQNWIKIEEEIDKLLADAREARYQDNLKGYEKEDAAITAKWDAEIEKYAAHADRVKELEEQKQAELDQRRYQRWQESQERAKEINEETDSARWEKIFSDADLLQEFELETERQKALEKARIAEASAEEIAAINKKFDDKAAVSGQKWLNYWIGLKQQEVKWADLSETKKLAVTKQGLNLASDMVNKGSAAWKLLKMGEVAISTYQAATVALAQLGPIGGPIAAGVVTAMGLMNVRNIAKTKLDKQPKFFKGGWTGTKGMFTDQYGPVTGVVHKNEYVIPESMTQDPRYANAIGWFEAERIGKRAAMPVPEPAALPAVSPGADIDMNGLTSAVNNMNGLLLTLLENGIDARANFGYKDVEDLNKMNTELQNSNKYGKIN